MKSNVTLLDDTGGTGEWRAIWPINLLWPILRQDEQITVSKQLPLDPNYYAVQNTIMIQRWTLPEHRMMFDKAVFPAASAGMANIVYNIDDCMGGDAIPMFNRAHLHYSKPEIQENIKYILQRSDFLLVTTDELKKYYIDNYGVNPDNFILIPNMLPRSWAFGLFDDGLRLHNFMENKKRGKLRVGFISSSSHFNVSDLKWSIEEHDPVGPGPRKDGKYKSYVTHKTYDEKDIERIPDDIDDIMDVIEKTTDKFEWFSIGQSKSPRLLKLISEKKMTIVNQVDILHYMQLVRNMQLDAIIAPLRDTRFNHCKSEIKYLESAAVGSLLYAPKVLPYTEHVPTDQLWRAGDNDDLLDKLMKLYEMSEEEYVEKIRNQYKFLNTPMKPVNGPMLKNLWLDDNIDIWKQVLFMPRNGMKISLKQLLSDKRIDNPRINLQANIND